MYLIIEDVEGQDETGLVFYTREDLDIYLQEAACETDIGKWKIFTLNSDSAHSPRVKVEVTFDG